MRWRHEEDGFGQKLYVHDPEGELTHVVAQFTALTRPAQDKETNVEEVGDSALILVSGVEIIPSFMHEVMVTGPTQSRGGSPGRRFASAWRGES